jgi:hypothetical protein
MEKSYGKDTANHTGPESCDVTREGGVEALTEESTGREEASAMFPSFSGLFCPPEHMAQHLSHVKAKFRSSLAHIAKIKLLRDARCVRRYAGQKVTSQC